MPVGYLVIVMPSIQLPPVSAPLETVADVWWGDRQKFPDRVSVLRSEHAFKRLGHLETR